MAAMKKRLTDKFVASVKAPKDVAQVDYFDEGLPCPGATGWPP